MSDTVTLALEKREITGKQVKQLRRAGKVPAVIHDHGKESVIVAGEFLEVSKVYQQAGKHHPVVLDAAGKKYTALIKDADFDPRTNFITHVVFNAVNANQKVDAEIPVRAKYDEGNDSSPAERTGYIVLQQAETIEVTATPSSLPDVLEYDAEKLVNVGDQVTVADLIVPKNVEIKAEPEHVLATVFEPSALQAANEDAGGTAEEAAPEAEAEAESADADEKKPAEA